ncbi:MAG: molybdopterin-dependent oxidoreductase [Marinibacterium sp.]|nr:molybdopterin-dependent oxidoreductase [Marinibacterium sp.]
MTLNTSRRGFLKAASASAAVLVIGLRPNGALAAGDAQLNPFVKVGSDGRVIAVVKHFEMGQGPTTGLSTLIADELGVTMEQVDFEFAPSNPALYGNSAMGGVQGTGGSTAMISSFMPYRQAGAAARDMLIRAAAQSWSVDAGTLDIVDGMVTGAGQSAPLGDFVALAATLDAPAEPVLKDPSKFRLIGNPSVRRLDSPAKVNGTAKFGMDVHLPDQMVVMIARAPQRGAKVSGVDDSAAHDVKGYIQAQTLPTQLGVAVYAENTWAAMQARDALDITWDLAEAETRDSETIKSEILAALAAEPTYNTTKSDHAAITAAIDAAPTVVERTFYFPLLAHAPMEPVNCTIEATETGGIRVHDAAQIPTIVHGAMAQVFQLPMEQIEINTLLSGGSFGRRATPTADYQVEAAMAFAMTDGSRPVKLVWSREDDIRGGYYRPAFGHRVRVGLNDAGEIVGWDHRVAGQSIMKGTAFESFVVHDGVDHSSIEGTADTPYQIPGLFVGLTDTPKATSTLWWRSVGHTHTAYAMEVMMDEAARAVGRDAVEFRLAHLQGDGPDQRRNAEVLRLVAEKAGWGQAAPGRSQGIAVHKSFGSYAAEVVEISGDAASGVQIEKVTCAIDCGIAVNPDVIKAQMEGGIGYGIGAAMRDEITLTGGEVDQFNFPDYEPLRISDIGAIEVHIVPSTEHPSGVGEPGTPPAAPALANAISAAGHAVAVLPMINDGVNFA